MKNQGLASAVSLSGWRSKREISSGHYHQHFLDATAILLLNLPLTISGQTPTWRHMIPANLAHPLSGGHLMIIALVTPSSLCKILFSCREVITNTLLAGHISEQCAAQRGALLYAHISSSISKDAQDHLPI